MMCQCVKMAKSGAQLLKVEGLSLDPETNPDESTRGDRGRFCWTEAENNANSWKFEHRCYFCGPGCAEVGRALHQCAGSYAAVTVQCWWHFTGEKNSRNWTNRNLRGRLGAYLPYSLCYVRQQKSLLAVSWTWCNLAATVFKTFWLITGTTLRSLMYPHDWRCGFPPDLRLER